MQRILHLMTVLITVVVARQAPAQPAAAAEESPILGHVGYVIVHGGEGLSPQLVNIVADSVQPRLPDWPKDLDPGAVVVGLSDEVSDPQEIRIAQFAVQVLSAKVQPSEAEMRQLWDLARGQLENELQRVAELRFEAQQIRLERELNELLSRREKIEHQAASLAEKFAVLEADTAGHDRDTLAKAIAEAVSNLRGLQLEDAGLTAHRQAIEQRIDELRKQAAEADDPIVGELQRIVAIREHAHQRLEEADKRTPNAIAKEQLLEAEGRIAEAKIELLRARREAEDRSSGGALRELTKELSKLMVESAKVEGQRKQLEKTVANLREQVRQTAQASATLSQVQMEMRHVHSRREHLENQMGNLQHALDQLTEPEVLLQPLMNNKADAAPEPEASAPGESATEDEESDNGNATE